MRRLRFVSYASPAVILCTAAVMAAAGCGPKTDAGKADGAANSEDKAKAEAEAEEAEAAAKAKAEAEAQRIKERTEAWKDWSFTPIPAGLDVPPGVPEDNPMSAEKVALGHKLFMDKRLSFDGSRSCYSCHQNHLGNADGRPKASGAGNKDLSRNTPTIWNVAYHASLYWDGRAPSLEKQALGAWKGGNMGVGADNLAAKAAEIGALPEYKDDFAKIFELGESDQVTPDHVAMALSTYERTLLCGDTAHDRNERSEAAQRGWDLFRGKAQCVSCHNGHNFTDGVFHNVGIGFDAEGKPTSDDIGRAKPSEDPDDEYKFRTPTLRNAAQTAPYFHDGSVASLEDAVRYMAGGGNAKAPNQDPLLRNVALTDDEIKDVVAFIESLTCDGKLEEIGDQSVPDVIAPPA